MFKVEIPEAQRRKASEFLEEITTTPAAPSGNELEAAQAKRAELTGALEAVQRDGAQPLEEAAGRIVLLRTQLELLGGRIAGLEKTAAKNAQAAAAKAVATRKGAVDFVIEAACDVQDMARAAAEGMLRPWWLGQEVWGEAIDKIPFIALISDRVS
jgi:hypothetical protein